MKRIISNVIWGLIMATFMSALFGCSDVDKKAIDPIVANLSAKYGKSFTIYALGDRLGKDTATAYVYPDDDRTLMFTARSDSDGNLVFENYAYRLLCRKVEDVIVKTFSEYGINAVCFVSLYGTSIDTIKSVDISFSDYIDTAKPEGFSVSIAIESSTIHVSTIDEIYKKLYEELHHVTIGSLLYMLDSEDYKTVAPKIQLETQLFDGSRLKLYGAGNFIKEVQLKYDGMSLTSTTNDLHEEEL